MSILESTKAPVNPEELGFLSLESEVSGLSRSKYLPPEEWTKGKWKAFEPPRDEYRLSSLLKFHQTHIIFSEFAD